jgi:uncharacterized RDD family membrane protein YckC
MQDENPYQSPTEVGFVESTFNADPTPASAWRRLVNLLLDQVGCLLLGVVVAIIIVIPAVLLHKAELLDNIPDFLLGILMTLLYYVPQEALWGKTLAKFVTGTRVVSISGARPTFGQIVGRTFCRIIPFEAFTFLFGGGNPVGWHDKFSNTRVVMDR